jgi:hypothetical protein
MKVYLITSALVGVTSQRHAPRYPGKDPLPILQEAGWAPGPVWTGAENLVTTGIRSPDLPARNASLYRLRYPGPHSLISLIRKPSALNLRRKFSSQYQPSVLIKALHTSV